MATGKSKEKKVEVFDSEEDLSVSLAKYTADLSEKFTKERSAFTVVLSGGSLIKSLRYKSFSNLTRCNRLLSCLEPDHILASAFDFDYNSITPNCLPDWPDPVTC